jgi:hypothetical protein
MSCSVITVETPLKDRLFPSLDLLRDNSQAGLRNLPVQPAGLLS